MNALGMPAAAEPRRLRGAAESGVPVRAVATSSAGAGAGWLKPEPPFLPGLARTVGKGQGGRLWGLAGP